MSLGLSLVKREISEEVNCETLYTLHFTSERKCMSVLVKDNILKENFLLSKGAGEVIL